MAALSVDLIHIFRSQHAKPQPQENNGKQYQNQVGLVEYTDLDRDTDKPENLIRQIISLFSYIEHVYMQTNMVITTKNLLGEIANQ